MKIITILIITTLFCIAGVAQKSMTLSLNDVILLAQSNSLQSYLNKNYFLIDYWQYRSYKANFLPFLSLSSNPISYNNSSSLRYNSNSQTDEFTRTESLSSNAEVNLSQKLGLTGGNIYVSSDLSRIENYGERGYIQYSSTPFRIGYNQDLFGFNELKWSKKTEPLKYEKAQKEYIQSVEKTNLKTIEFFFQFAISLKRLKIAEYNLQTTDTLLQIANKRFSIGTVANDEVLDLKLSRNNHSIEFQEAKMNFIKAKDALLVFLMLPKQTDIHIVLPFDIPDIQIETRKALDIILERNPLSIEHEINVLLAKQEVAKAKTENRFKADLNLSYGISKNDGRYDSQSNTSTHGEVSNVYKTPYDDYQVVNIGVKIPVLDWGSGKGQYKMALSRKKIEEIAAKQAFQDFEQNTITQILEFNLQKEKVSSAALSDSLAKESYELTMLRFRKGKADVLKLISSQNAKDNAGIKYVSSLHEYWRRYYELREMALYDFEKGEPLLISIPDIIN